MGRFTIEELAHLDLLLLSDECYYFTGAAIAMDGGQQVAGRGMFAGLTRLIRRGVGGRPRAPPGCQRRR